MTPPSIASDDLAERSSYAGFGLRALALMIDQIILSATEFLILVPLFGWNISQADTWGQWIVTTFMLWIFPAMYCVLFWIFYSATPGKMLLRLRIIDGKTGNEPTPRQSVIRYVGYFLSILPLGIGLAWAAFDHKKRGWHDFLAETEVIRDPSTVRWSMGRKILIGTAMVFGLGCGGILASRLVKRVVRNWAAQALKGPGRETGAAYAKTHSQIECVDAGLAGARSAKSFGEIMQNSLFLQSCLGAAAASGHICDGIPKQSELSKTIQWRVKLQRSLQCPGPACNEVLATLQRFCEKPDRPPSEP